MTAQNNLAATSDLAKAFQAVSIAQPGVDHPTSGKPARKKRKRLAPFSLRLTANERAKLEQAAKAAGMALAAYIKLRLFNNLPPLDTLPPSRPGGRPATDTQLIAKLLAALGEARLSQNLNQLAKAVNMGALPVTPETEAELVAACADVRAMRADLVSALGLRGPRGRSAGA